MSIACCSMQKHSGLQVVCVWKVVPSQMAAHTASCLSALALSDFGDTGIAGRANGLSKILLVCGQSWKGATC